MTNFDEQLHQLVIAALQEDVGNGDHSTLSCIPPNQQGKAVLKIKQAGILAGVAVAEKIFKQVEPTAQFIAFKKDGDLMV
ncbi:MAG TPA: nicotinate-nucleotide diphosphorylase (carboxylating), partial [Chitinophagaceae bacterium]|nr:nicotinate-nucleotide diphosphorylase (carboxylating) [Chitinophagaceae bacterium]